MTTQYPIFTQKLQREGFDIVFPFPLSALDDATLAKIPSSSIPLHGRCGIIIANTGSVWLPFLLWLRDQPDWRSITDPFDTFAEHIINLHCDATFPGAQVYWTHETKKYMIPAQRIAHESGFAFLSKGHFNVHPHYGPWFAMRAVVVLSHPPPPKVAAINPSEPMVELRAAQLFEHLCRQTRSASDETAVQQHWRSWLQLREIYDVGKEHRYTDDQIQYHYTRETKVLERAIQSLIHDQESNPS